MISTLNNLVFNLGEAIAKSSVVIAPDVLKLAIEIIVAF
jgi:hypothetical protein